MTTLIFSAEVHEPPLSVDQGLEDVKAGWRDLRHISCTSIISHFISMVVLMKASLSGVGGNRATWLAWEMGFRIVLTCIGLVGQG